MGDALSRDRWTDAALEALARGGLGAVRVEPLARRLRVTKGSFYWHFGDRDELLSAMLARWEQVATGEIIDRVEAVRGPARARLVALFEFALGAGIMPLEVALREWARHDPRAARALERVDGRRLDFLARLFAGLGLPPEETEARAFLAYATLFGDHFIAPRGRAGARRAILDRAAALVLDAPAAAPTTTTTRAATSARRGSRPRAR